MKRKRGFTLVELLIVVSIIALLVTLVLPTLGRARFLARRAVCAANLNSAAKGLNLYTGEFEGKFPTCGYGPHTSRFDVIGASIDRWLDSADSNSRNLFLAVRQPTAGQGEAFISPDMLVCPSTDAVPADVASRGDNKPYYDFNVGTKDNYKSKLSYSYHLQFRKRINGPKGYPLVQSSPSDMALLADKNPNVVYPGETVNGGVKAKKIDIAENPNSPNHEHEGQNVAYKDGRVEWQTVPTAGVENDNIYTVWSGSSDDWDKVGGAIDAASMPRGRTDSFLVP